MPDLIQELQTMLWREIALSTHMGITIVHYDSSQLILKAPLAPNKNHKQTAFGGSLNAAATLACWSMLWMLLQERELQAHIVIQESNCHYLRPVTEDFSVCCRRPSDDILARMEKLLQSRGKARLELAATIETANNIALTFKGRYVLQKSSPVGSIE